MVIMYVCLFMLLPLVWPCAVLLTGLPLALGLWVFFLLHRFSAHRSLRKAYKSTVLLAFPCLILWGAIQLAGNAGSQEFNARQQANVNVNMVRSFCGASGLYREEKGVWAYQQSADLWKEWEPYMERVAGRVPPRKNYSVAEIAAEGDYVRVGLLQTQMEGYKREYLQLGIARQNAVDNADGVPFSSADDYMFLPLSLFGWKLEGVDR